MLCKTDFSPTILQFMQTLKTSNHKIFCILEVNLWNCQGQWHIVFKWVLASAMATWLCPNYCEEGQGRCVDISTEGFRVSDVPRALVVLDRSFIRLFFPEERDSRKNGMSIGKESWSIKNVSKAPGRLSGFHFIDWPVCRELPHGTMDAKCCAPRLCCHPPLYPRVGLQIWPLWELFSFFHNLIDSTCCYPGTAL